MSGIAKLSKKESRLNLMMRTADVPTVDEMMRAEAMERPELDGSDTDTSSSEGTLPSNHRFKTGMGVATQAAILQGQVERLKEEVKVQAITFKTSTERAQSNFELILERAKESQAAVFLDLSLIDVNPWQPRMVFHDEAMIQLKDSISSAGVLQPIAVRKNPDDSSRYQLIAGERRTIAARSLGLKEIPAVILKVDDSDLAAQSLAENIVRDDLSDFEIGTALSRMLTEFPSKVQLAQSFGVSRSQLYRLLSFASLPKFIIDDLEKNPALLGGSISKDLVPLVSGADPKFLAELESAWQDVKLGKISQNQLIDRTNQLISPTAKILNGSRVKQALTFNGHKHGVFTADDTNTIVKFKSSSLSAEKSKELLNFLNVFISTL